MARVAFVMTHPFMQWKNGVDIGTRTLARQLAGRGHACELHVFVRSDAEPYVAPADVRLHRAG